MALLLLRQQSPPPIDNMTAKEERSMMETALFSRQTTESSSLPFALAECSFLFSAIRDTLPLLDELCSDFKSSFDADTASNNSNEARDEVDSIATKQQCASCRLTSPERKSVRFSTAEIRQYDLTVGDSPFCASLPLSLDWSYSPNVQTIDLCEESSESQANPVRRLNLLDRMNRLKLFHKTEDVWCAERERRHVLEEEGALPRAPTEISLCGTCTLVCEEDDDDYFGEDDLVVHDERQLAQLTADFRCDPAQWLEASSKRPKRKC